MKPILTMIITLFVLVNAQAFFFNTCGRDTVCKDDRVIFKKGERYYTGVVTRVSTNGRIKINSDKHTVSLYGDISEDTSGDIFGNKPSIDKPSVEDVSEIGKGVNCFNEICKDNHIIFKEGERYYTGVVTSVFNNGKIKVNSDKHKVWLYGDISEDTSGDVFRGTTHGDTPSMDVSDIGKRLKCFNKICKDNRVIFKKGKRYYTGVVTSVFNNGKIKINSDKHKFWLYGDNPKDTSGDMFREDMFRGITPENKSPMDVSDIGTEVACSNKICKDDRVMFEKGGSHYAGVVTSVFNNGRIKINSDSHKVWLYSHTQELTKILDE